MKDNFNKFGFILFVIYLFILTWIILFKMQFSFDDLPGIYSLNLVPFGQSVIVNGKIHFEEIIDNCLVFVPVGIYVCMLFYNKRFSRKVILPLLLSLFYEIVQFIFCIGASDITDVIMNTLGGVIGIAFLDFVYEWFKDKNKVDMTINVMFLICILLFLGLAVLLLVSN